MIDLFTALYKKHKTIIIYIIFGVLTTAVDFVSYIILTKSFGIDENISNVISQILAIIFAFVTNKIFVFEDKDLKPKALLTQFAKFTSLRLVTLLLNSGMFFVMTESMHVNDIITKVLVSVIVIILNYIFSKLIVFKKTNKG
ncbi:MAG: GtrA family protein [Ruminococcaceae bacterium]|nr:GtrA family protein [Oscillospiraceae bacterium]